MARQLTAAPEFHPATGPAIARPNLPSATLNAVPTPEAPVATNAPTPENFLPISAEQQAPALLALRPGDRIHFTDAKTGQGRTLRFDDMSTGHNFFTDEASGCELQAYFPSLTNAETYEPLARPGTLSVVWQNGETLETRKTRLEAEQVVARARSIEASRIRQERIEAFQTDMAKQILPDVIYRGIAREDFEGLLDDLKPGNFIEASGFDGAQRFLSKTGSGKAAIYAFENAQGERTSVTSEQFAQRFYSGSSGTVFKRTVFREDFVPPPVIELSSPDDVVQAVATDYRGITQDGNEFAIDLTSSGDSKTYRLRFIREWGDGGTPVYHMQFLSPMTFTEAKDVFTRLIALQDEEGALRGRRKEDRHIEHRDSGAEFMRTHDEEFFGWYSASDSEGQLSFTFSPGYKYGPDRRAETLLAALARHKLIRRTN